MSGVTAIVPTYNRAGYLGECIESLLRQTLPPDEIMVVDDGSVDTTAEVAHAFGDKIIYRYQENSGKSAALNAAISAARGDRIWIVDDDDIACADALELLSGKLDEDSASGFSFGHYDNFRVNELGEISYYPGHTPPIDINDLFYSLLLSCFIFQPALLVRRECYAAVGPFDIAFARAQDYEMLLRLAARYRGGHVARVVFHQRQHSGNRGPSNFRFPASDWPAKQASFNSRVFEKVRVTFPSELYLPWNTREKPLNCQVISEAMLRRVAFLVYRAEWIGALKELIALNNYLSTNYLSLSSTLVRKTMRDLYPSKLIGAERGLKNWLRGRLVSFTGLPSMGASAFMVALLVGKWYVLRHCINVLGRALLLRVSPSPKPQFRSNIEPSSQS